MKETEPAVMSVGVTEYTADEGAAGVIAPLPLPDHVPVPAELKTVPVNAMVGCVEHTGAFEPGCTVAICTTVTWTVLVCAGHGPGFAERSEKTSDPVVISVAVREYCVVSRVFEGTN